MSRGETTLRETIRDDETHSSYLAKFVIGAGEIAGPLDLETTVKSGQTAMPEWLGKDSAFTDLMPLQEQFVAFTLRQTSGPFQPNLKLEIQGSSELNRTQIQEARTKIINALDLKRDLETLYREFSDDVLFEAFERFPGLRLMRAWDPFEALISCMLTQWSSIKGWNTVARRLRKRFGVAVRLAGRSVSFASPSPGSLADASLEELRGCGTGFRAEFLKEAGRLVAGREISLAEVGRSSYFDAKERLMEIPGVGTKVADCLLLYGFGMMEAAPVDVWMHRVIQRLYLKGERVNQRKAEEFLREHFGSWAGYAQLYLYHYARMKRVL